MSTNDRSRLAEILEKNKAELLAKWLEEQKVNLRQASLIKETELRSQCEEFLNLLREAVSKGGLSDLKSNVWDRTRELLGSVSRSRGLQGFTPSETAMFVFSLKRPVFELIRQETGRDAEALARETWNSNELFDRLGLYTTEVYQKAREEVIQRQQRDMIELSTPVVKLWDGILALPLIGTLDSERTQIVMESLLQRIVETEAEVAILDITGVPTVDTLVAQHLIKTVTAARLMGADCIISGIRPQIAQTIVHLGVDLRGIVTKSSLADAFAYALKHNGSVVSRASAGK